MKKIVNLIVTTKLEVESERAEKYLVSRLSETIKGIHIGGAGTMGGKQPNVELYDIKVTKVRKEIKIG